MRSIKFWRMAVKELSLTERMFFRDAIKTLFAWDVLKGEYPELDLIMRILESEIHLSTQEVIPALTSLGSPT
jgi:hypothetical protein